MKATLRAYIYVLTVIFTSLITGLALTNSAGAGCVDKAQPNIKSAAGKFAPAVYYPKSGGGTLIHVVDEDWDDHWHEHSIVGLWEFEFHLDDGTLFDWGLAQWHEDGTEIQNSGARTPAAGDVCMGVWRREGRAFKLNHIALGLTPPTASGQFVGPTQIHATVTLDQTGTHFAGRQTLSVYPGSAASGTEFNTKGTPLAVFSGTITAKRVEVDD